MAESKEYTRYDDMLASILVNEKSILGFLSAIFNFLGRRTDFYYVPEGAYENMGFPEGVAEELVLKVLKNCDPNKWHSKNVSESEIHDDIMCSTVAQEVEIEAEEDETEESETAATVERSPSRDELSDVQIEKQSQQSKPVCTIPDDYKPPVIPTQKNSESYNGAVRDKYTWAQYIMELDVTIRLPPDIKKSKDLNVVINPSDISVMKRNGEVLIKDSFPYKIKSSESMWSISEGRLLIHLEKAQERWWKQLLSNEEPIDLDKIDCSRPIDELPEDHLLKIRELQWNQERKLQGLPTTDEMRNIEVLKKAWDAEGSPFKGKKFDPSVLHK